MMYFRNGFNAFTKCSDNILNRKALGSLPKERCFSHQTTSHFREMQKKKDIGPIGIALLVVPIASFGLGTWQVQRKKWKDGLIESMIVKTKSPPVPLPTEDAELKELEFRCVRVEGEFDHSGEIFLGPRSCLIEGQSKANEGKVMSSEGVSGYLVITPFVLAESGERILVNRGWVSFQQKNASTRKQGQLTGVVQLDGVIRLTEPRSSFTPLNKRDSRIWFSRDVESMSEVCETRPVFLDACVESTVAGGPIGGQTRATLRNEHLSYIITWYCLSAATAFMWYTKFIR